jgi:hypothetical protein
MNLCFRAIPYLVCIPLVAGILGVCARAGAQEKQSTNGETAKSQTKEGPQKPVWDPGWVKTSDPVALLTVRQAPKVVETPKVEKVAQGIEARSPEDPAQRKAAEIASVEKQIQEKQARIVFLLRLFVNDERLFLNDPGNPAGDAAARERRKYEQDELLYETAQLAKLKAELEGLRARK